jgi:hypothetical protein
LCHEGATAFSFEKECYFSHGCARKNTLDKRFKAVTDVKNKSPQLKHVYMHNNGNLLTAGGGGSGIIR